MVARREAHWYIAPVPSAEEEQKQKEKDDAQVVDKDFAFSRLWILELDSLKAREVVTGEFMVGDPQWSPDGGRIAIPSRPRRRPTTAASGCARPDRGEGQSRKLLESRPDNAPRCRPWCVDRHPH
jgi:hypothetical protein